MGYKVYIWTDRYSYLAVAHAESVTQARQLLEDNDLGGTDGSCPERASARKSIYENNPTIFHGPVAEFAIIGVDGQLRLEDERDRLRAELEAALEASGSNAKAWQDTVCDEAVKRSQLLAEIGLTEQQRDAAIARAEAAEGRADSLYRTLLQTVLAFGGVAQEGLSDAFLQLGVPAEAAAVIKRMKEQTARAEAAEAALAEERRMRQDSDRNVMEADDRLNAEHWKVDNLRQEYEAEKSRLAKLREEWAAEKRASIDAARKVQL